ncbi:hypothetical protein [Anderseniella sp. Alg231-50]|uniref:hypothetical protein n=1 Tax=Anderseniella sp. Alg231-50 TaxID=1922226 RepID=UPI000D553A15
MLAVKQEPEAADFWAWFEDNEAVLAEMAIKLDDMTMDELEPVLDELALEIHDVDDRLFAELGVAEDGSPVLLITAEGDREALLAARDLVEIAPEFKNWEIKALREREELSDQVALPGGGEIDIREAVFVLEVHQGKAEIAIGLDEWDDERAEDYSLAAENLVEAALGEADYSAGVSGVMALPLKDLAEEADPWPLKALTSEFDNQLGA